MKKPYDPIDLKKVDDLVSAVVNKEPISSPSRPLETTLSIEELSEEMPDLDDQRKWKMYVLAKNYELTKSKDPDVRGKALERLAKTSVVGLYETRVQVSVSSLPTDELQAKLEKLVNRINEKVIGP
jgi:hypothetical protein